MAEGESVVSVVVRKRVGVVVATRIWLAGSRHLFVEAQSSHLKGLSQEARGGISACGAPLALLWKGT